MRVPRRNLERKLPVQTRDYGSGMKTHRLPTVAAGNIIPQLLHQIFFRSGEPGATMPDSLRRNVEELKSSNPGWDHRLWDEAAMEAFIAEHYGSVVLGYYHRIDPTYGAARADLFRYLLVYRLGGVYLDVKSRFKQPINDVLRLDEHFIVSGWRNKPGEAHAGWGQHVEYGGHDIEIQQWHVIASPGHPFLRAVIERVLDNIDRYSVRKTEVGFNGVLRLTGPVAYTLAIAPLLDRHPCTIIANETVIGLEYSAFERMEHQGLLKLHYIKNTTPVVRRSGVKRWIDLARCARMRYQASAPD